MFTCGSSAFDDEWIRRAISLAVGGIKLEWALSEGGKRVAELRTSHSKIRAAVAQAESIADTIGFQVTEAYRMLVTARLGIDRNISITRWMTVSMAPP